MFGVMLGDVARSSKPRRRIPRILAASLVAACWIVGGASPALAHPIGNFTINLYSGVHVLPGHVRIDYVLEMAEISTQEQKPGMDLDGDGEITTVEQDSWGDRASAQILTNLTLVANGQPVELTLTDSTMRFRPGQAELDLIYMTATFDGTLPGSGEVRYTDANYTTRPGWREISVSAAPGTAIIASSTPDHSVSGELKAYPPEMFDQPLNVTDATFSFQPSDAPVESTAPAQPGSDGSSSTGSSSPAGSGGFADLLATSSGRAIGLLLLLAFGFGFIHALGPGHGKTIMAASTLSGSVRLRHALWLGGIVALMHCLTVVGLGLIAYAASQTISSESVFSGLKLVTALVVAIVGAVMLVVRLRERRGHADHHGPHPSTPASEPVDHQRNGSCRDRGGGGIRRTDPLTERRRRPARRDRGRSDPDGDRARRDLQPWSGRLSRAGRDGEPPREVAARTYREPDHGLVAHRGRGGDLGGGPLPDGASRERPPASRLAPVQLGRT